MNLVLWRRVVKLNIQLLLWVVEAQPQRPKCK